MNTTHGNFKSCEIGQNVKVHVNGQWSQGQSFGGETYTGTVERTHCNGTELTLKTEFGDLRCMNVFCVLEVLA